DAPSSSSCTCKSAFTADTTDPVLGVELARKVIVGDMNGTPANAYGEFWIWSMNLLRLPLLLGQQPFMVTGVAPLQLLALLK
ncbi:hypothetical protein KKB3_01593, partial [Dehalococcoides mccartyi]